MIRKVEAGLAAAGMTIALAGCNRVHHDRPNHLSENHPSVISIQASDITTVRRQRPELEQKMRELARALDLCFNPAFRNGSDFLDTFRQPNLVSDQDLATLFANEHSTNIPSWLSNIAPLSSEIVPNTHTRVDRWMVNLGPQLDQFDMFLRYPDPSSPYFKSVLVLSNQILDVPYPDSTFHQSGLIFPDKLFDIAKRVYNLPNEMKLNIIMGDPLDPQDVIRLTGVAQSESGKTTVEFDQLGASQFETSTN